MLFCILFVAFIVGLVVVSLFGFKNGKPERLLAPLDANGMFCGLANGVDQKYVNYPYLYLLDLSAGENILASAVCVSKCPLNNTEPVDCIPTTAYPSCDKFVYPFRYNSTLGIKSYIIKFIVVGKACLPILTDLPLPG